MPKRIKKKGAGAKTAAILLSPAGLNPEQERFSQLYASDKEFFGNGVESYLEVYDIDRSKPNWYKTACSAASQLLSNIKVCNRINELLSDEGLNDQFVDKQTLFLITQHEDKKAKIASIREYNKVKKRVDDATKVKISFSISELLNADNSEGH